MIVLVILACMYFAAWQGYEDAKHKYQCHQVGGMSATVKGEKPAAIKFCR